MDRMKTSPYLPSEVEDDELGGVEARFGVARALAQVGVVVQLQAVYTRKVERKDGKATTGVVGRFIT